MQNHATNYIDSYKTAFLACLILTGTVAIYRWFIVPHLSYLNASQKYESTISTLANKKKIISNDLNTKQIKYSKLQERFDNLQSQLFDPLGEREFFGNIDSLCKEAACKMLSLTFSQSSVKGSIANEVSQVKEYAVANSAHLIVESGFGNIITLMNKLQDSSKFVRINPVNINPDNKNPGCLKCDMTITIYVTNEKKEQ